MTKNQFALKLRALRQDVLGLSQMQLAALVGMGVATINRYENGTEPTEAHRQLLEGLLSDPDTLYRLLKGKEELLGEATCQRLAEIAEERLAKASLLRIEALQKQITNPKFTGKREFDLERLVQMVRFFTQTGEWKTKLNKLLFYADFLAFNALGQSISGTRYVRGSYGPIPDRYHELFSALIECNELFTREEYSLDGQPLERLFSKLDFDRSPFSKREIQILQFVLEYFKNKSAKEVVEFSHEESAFNEAADGDGIPYSKAKDLNLHYIPPKTTIPTKSLAEVAREIAAAIPDEELDRLPPDASINHDHYLYGSPKRRP